MSDRKPIARATANASHERVASAVRRDETGLTRESGCERGNLTGVDAHAKNTPIPPTQPPLRALVRAVNCRYCDSPIYLAICRDGRWRSFERRLVPAAPALVWAWRRRHGMEETEHSPGHHLHYCAGYSHFLNGATA